MATSEEMESVGPEIFKLAEKSTLGQISEDLIDNLGAFAMKQKIYPSTVLLGLGDVDDLWPNSLVDDARNARALEVIAQRDLIESAYKKEKE